MGDLPLCLELSQAGKMIHPSIRHSLAGGRLPILRQGKRPAVGSAVPDQFLEYSISGARTLPTSRRSSDIQGKNPPIRRTILMSAWLGDAAVARSQWRQLQGLGGKLDWKESACLVLAHIPLPRRSLTVAYRRITPRLVRMGLNARALYGERRVGPARWIGPRLRG